MPSKKFTQRAEFELRSKAATGMVKGILYMICALIFGIIAIAVKKYAMLLLCPVFLGLGAFIYFMSRRTYRESKKDNENN